jgi:hypothetical protein
MGVRLLHYLIRLENGTDKIENEEPIIKLGTLENAFEDVFLIIE